MHAYTRTPNHKRVHIVSQPESFLMEIHKINLQMAKRVNIVASYHSQTNGNVIMDTPLELAHTHIRAQDIFTHQSILAFTYQHMNSTMMRNIRYCFARHIIPFWLFHFTFLCCILFSRLYGIFFFFHAF